MDNDLRRKLFIMMRSRKQWMPTCLELVGLGVVLTGLWIINPIVSVIGFGALLLLLAQGISRRDDT